MNQFERANALHVIDGYHLPHPNEKAEATFERARLEAVQNLRRALENVEAITFDRFTQRHPSDPLLDPKVPFSDRNDPFPD